MKLFAVRKIDELGRLVLPTQLRKQLGLKANTSLDIWLDGEEQVVLRKSAPYCIICGELNGLSEIAGTGRFICAGCKNSIQEMND